MSTQLQNTIDDDTPELPSKYGYSEWYPRLWHGMTLGAWCSLVRGNIGKIAVRRYPLVATIFVTATANSIISMLLNATGSQRIAQTKFERDPVFVLGFWRSGTTWLHEMMSCDPYHCSPTTLQCVAPKVFPLVERLQRAFGSPFPKTRPMDGVALAYDSPQEDEIAILNLGFASPLRYIAFPTAGWRELTGYWPADQAEWDRWARAWVEFLRHIQHLHPGKTLVLKSPAHTARVSTILRFFPNAKFIHISRNPYALFKSNLKSNRAMVATQSLEVPKRTAGDQETSVTELHKWIYGNFFPDVAGLRPDQICYLRYEDLQSDPIAQVERIYETLGLGTFEDALPNLRKFCQMKKDYRPEHHKLPEGEMRRLREEWPEYFKRFGYS